MGISKSTIRLIAKSFRDKKFSGKCITLGVQGVEGQYEDIIKILSDEGYDYKTLNEDELHYDSMTQFGNTLHQECFFKMLRFSVVHSLDYYPDENPSYVVDLNKPIDEELKFQYDLVYDGGTLEHCFNVKDVLSNAVRLLKIGGTVVHHVPLSGYIDHGFYQFSPTLFYDFYSENGFDEMSLKLHIENKNKAYYIDYDPYYNPVIPRFTKTRIFFMGKKGVEVEKVNNPIQSRYLIMFGNPKKNYKNASKDNFKKSFIELVSSKIKIFNLMRNKIHKNNLNRIFKLYREMHILK